MAKVKKKAKGAVRMKAWRGWCYVHNGAKYERDGIVFSHRPRPYDPMTGIRIARVRVTEVAPVRALARKGKGKA